MGSEPKQDLPPENCSISSTKLFLLPAVFLLSALLFSCGSGGGGASTQGPPGSSGDFSLSVSPENLPIQTGTSTQAILTCDHTNDFVSQVTVTVSGLPAGVTVSPSSTTLLPGGHQQLIFSASASAAVGNVTVTFTGTSGSLSHTAKMILAIIQPLTSNTPPFRMRYVRTDAATLYAAWLNSSWIIYNPLTNRFFMTDPYGNRVVALDASTETVVGSMPVPGAFGIDDTPDHSTVYVGTQIGDVYAIDPVNLKVTHRYMASQIGPSGFQTYSVQVMADGRLALLGDQGFTAGVNGNYQFAFWNPADNSLTPYQAGICGQQMQGIGVFKHAPDRSRLIIASMGGDKTLCEVDENGASLYVQPAAFVQHLAISPDGNIIALLVQDPLGLFEFMVLDAHTLAQISDFSVTEDTLTASIHAMFIAPDSRTLYFSTDPVVYAFDLLTGQQKGWLPNVAVRAYFFGTLSPLGPVFGPEFEAMDGTGLLAGPMEEGVGFLDTTALRTGAVGAKFLNSYLDPATGPINGGIQATWAVSPDIVMDYPDTRYYATGDIIPGTITDAYFGSQRAISVSSSTSQGIISATTPPGAPGPADVYAVDSDGGIDYVPEGFSYGPAIVQVTPNYSAADGGGTGVAYGYGFGPLLQSTSVPSGLSVTVGGQTAKITGFIPNAYGTLTAPFPLESFSYTIPPGQAGSSVDVSIISNSGTATLSNGMTYLPDVKQFPLAGAALAQGIYDPYNDLYFFTDATEIRVFSLTDHLWQPPITIPGAQRLWGIALSPDGTKMAVGDYSRGAIYVLNPNIPSSVETFPVPLLSTGLVATPHPTGLAITNVGIIYFTVQILSNADWFSSYYMLDANSGQTTSISVGREGGPTNDVYQRVVVSPDDSRVFFNSYGAVFSIDTASGNVSHALDDFTCCLGDDDLALSSSGGRLAATGYSYNSSLDAESYRAMNYREGLNISYLYGEKLSPDGRLLFQPTTNGIDVLDGKLGNLLDRIALPITLSPNYDDLVSDGKDNDLIAITGANGDGIAEVDLTSVPEPAPLPYVSSTVSNNHFAALKTSPPARRSTRPEQTSKQEQFMSRQQRIRHKTVRNLLRRFPQEPVVPR